MGADAVVDAAEHRWRGLEADRGGGSQDAAGAVVQAHDRAGLDGERRQVGQVGQQRVGHRVHSLGGRVQLGQCGDDLVAERAQVGHDGAGGGQERRCCVHHIVQLVGGATRVAQGGGQGVRGVLEVAQGRVEPGISRANP